ncbi:YdcF family protein [Aquirufa nivalisilvae]|uniref:YdcF family protein n=1 Tax=Aquirufa nivalisilvae TaxID=2516557 RepID=UPI001032A004|nr:YdcF family protein [Aquirufa nivalisilvae]TBH73662.1 YdcF family protein [Aquirufa nivalisilvae]
MQFQEVLIILGSPNLPNGQLGPIAMDRVNYCWELFQIQARPILCTGGFGAHFNTSPWAHAALLKQELASRGVADNYFLPLALSSNTVDDAVKSKLVIENYSIQSLNILTSQYHVPRVKLIFDEVLPSYSKKYYGVEHQSFIPELDQLIAHEAHALAEIKKNGLYF